MTAVAAWLFVAAQALSSGLSERRGALSLAPFRIATPPFEYTLVDSVEAPERVSLRITDNSWAAVGSYGDWFREHPYPALTFHGGGTNDAIRGEEIPSGVAGAIRVDGEILYLYQVIFDDGVLLATYGLPPNRFGVVLQPRVLACFSPGESTPLWSIDFSSYLYAPSAGVEGGLAAVGGVRRARAQAVRWADLEDGVLYVSHFHRTYAEESGGMNGFVTAIDPSSTELLWRSDPLVCNSENFLVVDGAIVCGYGFSYEDDYVYLIDRATGETCSRLAVDSAPDYLAALDGNVYVRCYNGTVVAEISRE